MNVRHPLPRGRGSEAIAAPTGVSLPVNRSRLCSLVLAAAFLSPILGSAQTPEALQASGIARLDRYVEHYRKTGDLRSQAGELQTAAAELESSYRGFAASSSQGQAAWSLVKAADCSRLALISTEDGALARPSRDRYETAAELARKAGSKPALVKALVGMAMIDEFERDYGSAAARVTEAVRAAASCPEADCFLDALMAKVQVETQRQELFSAASHVNGLLALLKNNSDPFRNYSAYLDRGSIYQAMADGCSYSFQKSLDVCLGLIDRAKADYSKARDVAARGGFAFLAEGAGSQVELMDFLRGAALSMNALAEKLGGTAIFDAKVPGDVAVSEDFLPKPTEADSRFVEGLRESLGLLSSGPQKIFIDARMEDMQGRPDAAMDGYLRALQTLEQDRRKMSEQSARSAFLNDKVNFYDPPILHLLEKKRYAEAFDLLERSLARATADLLATKSLELSKPVARSLFAALAVKRAEIASLQTRFFNRAFAALVEDDPTTVQASQARLTELETDYDALLLRAAREAPRVGELALAQPVSLEELRDNLKKDPADVLYYRLLDNAVVLIHIGPNSFHACNVFLPRAEVMRKAAALRASLSQPGAAFREDVARQLFLYLIQPALGWLSTDRLIFIPQGELQSLPFQAFQDPATGGFLGERFQVTYAPNASILLRLRKQRNLAGASLLAAGDPSLPGAAQEVRTLARLYPSRRRIVTDSLIRKADFKQWAGSYDILHLAVHGEFDSEEPLLSRVKLAGPAGEAAYLTAAEMFGLSLENTRLAALSACETGRVRATRSNEIQGIVQALLYAGAQSLLLSAWEVDSDSTSLWMQTFYREAQTKTPAEAARQAIRAVRGRPEYRHPFYWAPFLLIAR